MFRLEMLPAAHGDCLWIEYGEGRTVHRVLIDGGPAHTYPALRERILHLPAGERRFDLLIVTHIDADHIEGIIRLLQDAPALDCHFERIWFNGWEQLNRVPDPAGPPLGAMQGEYLSLLITDYEERVGKRVLNVDLPDGVAVVDRAAASLPSITLPGGCHLKLLSPDHGRLLELKDRWAEVLRKEGFEPGETSRLRARLEVNRQLRPLGDVLGDDSPGEYGDHGGDRDDGDGTRYELPDPEGLDLVHGMGDTLGDDSDEPGGDAPFGIDSSIANGSSIAVLVEYPADAPSVRMLLAGDAWASVLAESLDVLRDANKRLPLDGFKIPHHGSVANLSEALLEKVACKHYLISTSGARFRHPHARAVQLLLDAHRHRAKPRLHFNYLTTTTERWSEQNQNGDYVVFHPSGISLDL